MRFVSRCLIAGMLLLVFAGAPGVESCETIRPVWTVTPTAEKVAHARGGTSP